MHKSPSNNKFTQLVEDAINQSFTGWDFTYVDGRITESDTCWSYHDLAQQLTTSATAMVDMCTGGGEFLDSLNDLPNPTFATESYKPNVAIATQRLSKRGVTVVEVVEVVEVDEAIDGQPLPLPDQRFDLVINRHGAYSPEELRRIMKPTGATFLTQQVGSDNAIGLNEVLQAPPTAFSDWRLDTAIQGLGSLGFSITRREEEFPSMVFSDIGAVVYYLKAIPWQIPGFDLAAYREPLLALHRQMELNGPFETKSHRFLIEATLN